MACFTPKKYTSDMVVDHDYWRRDLINDVNNHSTGGVLAGAANTIGSLAAAQWKQHKSPNLTDMIAMRMHWRPGERPPFGFLTAHKLNDEQVVVFVVVGDKPAQIIDDWKMFPSDTLITQLRMLQGK